MSTTAVRSGTRPGRGSAVRLRLDVAEWLALRESLHEAVPGARTPAEFDPEALGLPPDASLSAAEHDRAWASLTARGLTRGSLRDLTGLVPGFAAGLLELLQPQLWVDVRGWSGGSSIQQSIAWSRGRTISLARRGCATQQRTVAGAHGAALDPEPAVELAISIDGSLIDEIWRALPDHYPAGRIGAAHPVRIGWHESAAVAQAMRTGRHDVARHLSGLPPEALALLGAASTTLIAGTSITVRREPTPRVRGVWLWTESDIIELLDATEKTVALRRSSTGRLRRDLLGTITELLRSEEVL